jgi:hypothetical protein
MKDIDLLHTHHWTEGNPRQFKQDGRTTIALRQCARCRRDFAQGLYGDGDGWNAVYLGIFKVEPLAKAVTDRWMQEPCPTYRVPRDEVDRIMTRNSADRRAGQRGL